MHRAVYGVCLYEVKGELVGIRLGNIATFANRTAASASIDSG